MTELPRPRRTPGRGTLPASVPAELIDDAHRGSQRALDAIFRTYQPGLLRYLRRVSPDLADDVASATWESVATSLDRFRGDGDGFRRWLFTIARRRLVDEVRRDTRRPLKLAELPEAAVDGPEPGDLLEGAEWAAGVLASIPTRQAEVVALRVLGGLPVDEVASLLGITSGNVRVLSHRGLQAISDGLEAPAADEDRKISGDA